MPPAPSKKTPKTPKSMGSNNKKKLSNFFDRSKPSLDLPVYGDDMKSVITFSADDKEQKQFKKLVGQVDEADGGLDLFNAVQAGARDFNYDHHDVDEAPKEPVKRRPRRRASLAAGEKVKAPADSAPITRKPKGAAGPARRRKSLTSLETPDASTGTKKKSSNESNDGKKKPAEGAKRKVKRRNSLAALEKIKPVVTADDVESVVTFSTHDKEAESFQKLSRRVSAIDANLTGVILENFERSCANLDLGYE